MATSSVPRLRQPVELALSLPPTGSPAVLTVTRTIVPPVTPTLMALRGATSSPPLEGVIESRGRGTVGVGLGEAPWPVVPPQAATIVPSASIADVAATIRRPAFETGLEGPRTVEPSFICSAAAMS